MPRPPFFCFVFLFSFFLCIRLASGSASLPPSTGFSIVASSIPDWLIWLYWINPLAYAIRGLSVNELTAARWGAAGPAALEAYGIPADYAWAWYALAFLWGSLLVIVAASAVALAYTEPAGPVPTVPVEEAKAGVTRALAEELERAASAASEPAASGRKAGVRRARTRARLVAALRPARVAPVDELSAADAADGGAFLPLTLVVRGLCYYVGDPSKGKAPGVVPADDPDKAVAGKLQLLRSIDLHAEPGELTALMGGSGAGKTTLMDVVAGRKTQGLIRGEILVNGHAKVQAHWARAVGYVEQMDIHSAQLTVRESLRFSARLRLEEAATSDARVRAVTEQVLDTVELRPLADAIVGEGGGDGLSTEQRKRLSIAVELAAQPSVLFLDEPTSGLDGRAAAIVMRVVRSIASSGRTVVSTIHQVRTIIIIITPPHAWLSVARAQPLTRPHRPLPPAPTYTYSPRPRSSRPLTASCSWRAAGG